MSYERLRLQISNKFISDWSGSNLNRVVFGKDSEPLSIGVVGDDSAPWFRLSFSILENENAEIGTGFQRATGIITLQIFTRAFSGDKVSLQLVDEFSDVFENKQFGDVTCYAPEVVVPGREGNSFQTNAKVLFEYEVFS